MKLPELRELPTQELVDRLTAERDAALERNEYFKTEIARLSNELVSALDERDALAAQVEQLRERFGQYAMENTALSCMVNDLRSAALNAISFMSGGNAKAALRDAYDATAEQCLAEIKAKAVADAVNAHPETIAYIQHYGQTRSKGDHYDIWLSSSDLIRYANQLHKAAKGGE